MDLVAAISAADRITGDLGRGVRRVRASGIQPLVQARPEIVYRVDDLRFSSRRTSGRVIPTSPPPCGRLRRR